MDTLQTILATPVHGRGRGASSPSEITTGAGQTMSSLHPPVEEVEQTRSAPNSPAADRNSLATLELDSTVQEQQPVTSTEEQAELAADIQNGSAHMATESTGSNAQATSIHGGQGHDFIQFAPYTGLSVEDIDRGIRQGYRSRVYRFLETRTPTDTLPDDEIARLPELERRILDVKKQWLSSSYPGKLAAIVNEIITARRRSPITNFVCLGDGTGHWLAQFLVFSQIVAQLSSSDPRLLDSVYVQDPGMSQARRSLFINHGCQVLEDPAAFEHINANTFLMSAFTPLENLVEGLEGRGIRELAMFIGDGEGILEGAISCQETRPSWIRTIGPLLDEELSCHRDVPADRVTRGYGGVLTFHGLAGLKIWWRLVLAEDVVLAVRLNHARSLCFRGSQHDFEAACTLGFSQLVKPLRDQIICSFVAAYQDDKTIRFQEYFQQYYTSRLDGGLSEKQRSYEEGIKRWRSIMISPEERNRSWLEYVKGDRSLHGQSEKKVTGWEKSADRPAEPSWEEKRLIKVKKRWVTTANARRLAENLAQIVRDRRFSPISNVVCLGIGVGKEDVIFDITQFMVVLEIAKHLICGNLDLLHNLYVQDSNVTPGMRDLFQKYGFQVVSEPVTFDLIGPNTCLISPFVENDILIPALDGKPIDQLAMFVGNGEGLLIEARKNAAPNSQKLEVLDRILDESMCDMVVLPCDEPENPRILRLTNHRTWPELENLDIWWRPSRTENEELNFCFKLAKEIGFPNDIELFRQGWSKGFQDLPRFMQNTVVLSFISGLDSHGSPIAGWRDFGSHVWEYVNRGGVLSEEQQILESHMDAWLSRSNAQTRRAISFRQFLKCKKALKGLNPRNQDD